MRKTRRRWWALVPLLGLSGGGCSNCTLELVSSVGVRVLGADGSSVGDAAVSYSVNGDAERTCHGLNGGFTCGGDEAGAFAIFARKAGYRDATANVTIAKDPSGCHVVPEEVQLTLVPSP